MIGKHAYFSSFLANSFFVIKSSVGLEHSTSNHNLMRLCSRGFRGALNWDHMMPRDASLVVNLNGYIKKLAEQGVVLQFA